MTVHKKNTGARNDSAARMRCKRRNAAREFSARMTEAIRVSGIDGKLHTELSGLFSTPAGLIDVLIIYKVGLLMVELGISAEWLFTGHGDIYRHARDLVSYSNAELAKELARRLNGGKA
jgi:hypothetical protein